ncbi:Transposon TX1 uncharacterized 149 kDa protein [Vitis vinifera]|uniref:Transposon TX1 uncharacterized 149 kDa protein n=1 Tax=Vitis vinifera TaxID=29760 RepID=A0A438HB16_VITVI|nr:Transposon TX1 uncharacterized 149 kDa protein [Vitis vinifera]
MLGHSEKFCDKLFSIIDGDIKREWSPDLHVPMRRGFEYGGERWLRETMENSMHADNYGYGNIAMGLGYGSDISIQGVINSESGGIKDFQTTNRLLQILHGLQTFPTCTTKPIGSSHADGHVITSGGLPTTMIGISWNCRGLGNPRTVLALCEINKSRKPDFIFLIETLVHSTQVEKLKSKLGFEDMEVLEEDGIWWRVTGFYGFPDRSQRHLSWNLLQSLYSTSSLPWCCLGDFNDIVCNEEKRGSVPHPPWLIRGFREAISDCQLQDLPLKGYPFTWERAQQMHPDKSPRPDGFNPAFFQHFWLLIGNDIFHACSSWLNKNEFPASLNETIIVLIPKNDNPVSMRDLWPIALCNVLYKIIVKVLANRLKIFLPVLIDESQSTFVLGKAIIDNVVVAFELIHYMKRKTHGKVGDVALKIDISKAYDRIR